MMIVAPTDILEKVQLILDKNCPPPEEDFALLGKSIASRPLDDLTGEVTRSAADTENLVDEMRWHIAQALLLWELYPDLDKIGESDNEMLKTIGFPGFAPLILRKYTRDATKVLYSDLSTTRKGGSVSGWIFQMMIDNSVYRSIAALDRIARILWVIAGGLPERVYFRSKQLVQIHNRVNEPESQELLAIAERDAVALLLDYRDGFTHDRKFCSRIAGFPVTHAIGIEDGRPQYERPTNIRIDDLFALANAGYHQVIDALSQLTKLCLKRWPIKKEYE